MGAVFLEWSLPMIGNIMGIKPMIPVLMDYGM